MNVRIPKRVPVDFLRKQLGDKRVEALLMQAYGPGMMGGTRLSMEQLQTTLSVLKGENGHGKGSANSVPLTFRVYYARHGQARAALTRWLEQEIQDMLTPMERETRKMNAEARARRDRKVKRGK
jgi:hypothetical protein